MAEVSTYRWSALPRVHRDAVTAGALAARLFPAFRRDALATVLAEAGDELGVRGLRSGRATTRMHHGPTFHPRLGDAIVLALHLPDHREPAMFAIDAPLGESLVAAILAGAELDRVASPLDDWSFGVLAFAVSRLLAAASARVELPKLVVSLERPSVEWLRERMAGPSTVVEVAVEMGSASAAGWVRFFATRTFVEPLVSAPRPVDSAHLGASATLPLGPSVSVGRQRLTDDEWDSLRPGDVVLLAEHVVKDIDADDFDDRAGRIWFAPDGFIKADIERDGARWKVTVRDLKWHEGGVPMNDDTQTTQLLTHTNVSVEAVIGRLELDLETVARMTPGQVFTVDRSVGDPLDVVANGRIVARAELVDVEGRLGMRILSLEPR